MGKSKPAREEAKLDSKNCAVGVSFGPTGSTCYFQRDALVLDYIKCLRVLISGLKREQACSAFVVSPSSCSREWS